MKILTRLAIAWAALMGAALIAKLAIRGHADPGEDTFDLVSIFDGRAHRPTTQTLRSGRTLSVFGGATTDLRRAGLAAGTATLDVVAVFGGSDVVVPDTWRVTTRTVDVLGGSSIRTTPDSALPADAPHLDVRCLTIFGGVSIAARPVLSAAEAG